MSDIKARRAKLLDETIAAYNSDNQAFDREKLRCCYITNDGRRCAIGRLLTEETCRELEEKFFGGQVEDLPVVYIPSEYRELGIEFLGALQSLHDRAENWTKTGVSEVGRNHAEEIRTTFCV